MPREKDLLDRLMAFLMEIGVADDQTAWELALDLEPIIRRLLEANRNVVTK